MEFLSCGFEGRALLFADDTDVAVDGSTRSKSKTPVNKWGGEGAVDSIGLIEPLLPNTRGNSFLGDQCLGRNGNVAKDHSCNSVQAASAITPNALMELGTSSPEPLVPAKRAKITNLQPPLPTCQVFGCNKDLSSSKDYHKRHKVCDVHSKTAVVIVNGIRQRFCQQCSRFHILAEFDEGKRSCRKRLAGHNERRRKPQLNTHIGSTYFTADTSNSLIFSRILPGGFFGLQCNEAADCSRRVKLKEEPRQASQLAVDVKLSQSVLRFHGMGKQYPSKNCLNAPSLLPELYSSSDSGSALSLLSARKQDLGMSTAHSLVSTGNHHHAYNLFTAQNSAPILGDSSSNNFAPVAYRSNGDAKVAVDSEISSTEPNTVKLDNSLSPQGANTVDLLELSLHLQRVEQQKYFGQIKMENDIFCDSTIA